MAPLVPVPLVPSLHTTAPATAGLAGLTSASGHYLSPIWLDAGKSVYRTRKLHDTMRGKLTYPIPVLSCSPSSPVCALALRGPSLFFAGHLLRPGPVC